MNFTSLAVIEKYEPVFDSKPSIQTDRIIALWALSEAMLGGVLHALKIPFTGLFVNSAAVLFMVLIAAFSQYKGAVLKATIIVLIIKGIVSPHTPLTAYLAVGFQGLMGELLLRSKKYLLPAAILLGTLTLLESALQKIVLLTVVYGQMLWESINVLGNYILSQISMISSDMVRIDFSLWLIGIYISLHLIAGILIGYISAKVPAWINHQLHSSVWNTSLQIKQQYLNTNIRKNKKSWLKKTSTLFILMIALALIILSYSDTQIHQNQAFQAFIMIIRSFFIMFIWYKLAGPYLLKVYQKLMQKKRSHYSSEVRKTLQSLGPLRYIISQIWSETKSLPLFRRFKSFVGRALIATFTVRIDTNEDN